MLVAGATRSRQKPHRYNYPMSAAKVIRIAPAKTEPDWKGSPPSIEALSGIMTALIRD
jgi:hypothetical protein